MSPTQREEHQLDQAFETTPAEDVTEDLTKPPSSILQNEELQWTPVHPDQLKEHQHIRLKYTEDVPDSATTFYYADPGGTRHT